MQFQTQTKECNKQKLKKQFILLPNMEKYDRTWKEANVQTKDK